MLNHLMSPATGDPMWIVAAVLGVAVVAIVVVLLISKKKK